MQTAPQLPYIEFCAGISAFHIASQSVKNLDFQCIGTSEIDSFCNTYLEQQGLNIFGGLQYVACPASEHPYAKICEAEDVVPCELNDGVGSLTYEDLMEGVVEWPKAIFAGWPCQSLSPANTLEGRGINGGKSDLYHDLMDKIEDLSAELVVLENSDKLTSGGLEIVVRDLTSLGYKVEWDIIAASAFGYPYYRHRCFVVAYNEESPLFSSSTKVLDIVAQKFAVKRPGEKFPFINNHSEQLLDKICTLESKGNYRRHRVAALGNSINVDIAYSILQTIADLYTGKQFADVVDCRNTPFLLEELESHSKSGFKKFPSRGYACKSELYCGERDFNLNPLLNQHKELGMMASLIRNDHKNNFTTTSRLSRPGGLGGLTGFFMSELGLNEGALNPSYCELYMGFPEGKTKVSSKLIRNKLLPN
ncbi:DNA cytosine methyltransferase [Vibrio parahaemolyticus]|uniref:DNA (Cytosine-5-)-methyltransferase n=1 Tax=Vibrio jasicida TaxID=766224 RepID=A0AAU9QTW3_9VIBR|nr:DNA cytosine methyltransferase [Vibrio parahaemolyticus]CAH1598748.1 DNA (cytosine-5-)-methyltransferase [Vibrio jasicida]CAH1601587.1 DNA (cytosine-5-)-methyltransferase [Vibrio jasicida]